MAADDVPCVECGLIPSDCRPDRVVEAMPAWSAGVARGLGAIAAAAAPLGVAGTMMLCLGLGVPGRFGDAVDAGHPLRQPMNQAVALMSGSAVSLSLLAGSLLVRSASRRAPQIQSIRWVSRLSLLGALASGACCVAAAIAWIPAFNASIGVRGTCEAIVALSALFAMGAVSGLAARIGAIVGAPRVEACRLMLHIACFVAIVSAILLPLGEYRTSEGSLAGTLIRAVPAVLLMAAAAIPVAWTVLMWSVSAHIDARLRARDGALPHRPVLLAASVACAVTLANWRVGIRLDHAHQVGSGAGPVVAWMVVLAPGAAAWIAGSVTRSVGIGAACGIGVVSAAMTWAIAT